MPSLACPIPFTMYMNSFELSQIFPSPKRKIPSQEPRWWHQRSNGLCRKNWLLISHPAAIMKLTTVSGISEIWRICMIQDKIQRPGNIILLTLGIWSCEDACRSFIWDVIDIICGEILPFIILSLLIGDLFSWLFIVVSWLLVLRPNIPRHCPYQYNSHFH